jgi:hypothetical protein
MEKKKRITPFILFLRVSTGKQVSCHLPKYYYFVACLKRKATFNFIPEFKEEFPLF